MLIVFNKDWNVQCVFYFHRSPRSQLGLLYHVSEGKVSAQDMNAKSVNLPFLTSRRVSFEGIGYARASEAAHGPVKNVPGNPLTPETSHPRSPPSSSASSESPLRWKQPGLQHDTDYRLFLPVSQWTVPSTDIPQTAQQGQGGHCLDSRTEAFPFLNQVTHMSTTICHLIW